MANVKGGRLAGTFSSQSTSDAIQVLGDASFQLDFGSGTVSLQTSIDGANFFIAKLPDGSTAATWTADMAAGLYFPTPTWVRFDCSSYTSTITYILQAREPLTFA
jgi:hypothetical protein